MPLDSIVVPDPTMAVQESYERFVAEAQGAVKEGRRQFAVAFGERKVFAIDLANEKEDVMLLTETARANPKTKAEFESAYEKFLASIGATAYREKAGPVASALALERELGVPLRSRRILDAAGFLERGIPIPAFRHGEFAGLSRTSPSMSGPLPGSSPTPGACLPPPIPVSGRATSEPESATWQPNASDTGGSLCEGPPTGSDDPHQSSANPIRGNYGTVSGTSKRNGVRNAHRSSKTRTTEYIYAIRWRNFSRWCTQQHVRELPATAETVAGYVEHRAEKITLTSIRKELSMITKKHCSAGYADPSRSDRVMVAIDNVSRRVGERTWHRRPAVKPLDETAIDKIRATLHRNSLDARNVKFTDLARRRKLVDIALCSVMYAAKLRIVEAAALEWRDVTKRSEREATITIRSRGSGPDDGNAIVTVGEQALRDLESIKPSGSPEGKVFRLSEHQINVRIQNAAFDAGLGSGFTGSSPRAGVAQRRMADETPGKAAAGPSGTVRGDVDT